MEKSNQPTFFRSHVSMTNLYFKLNNSGLNYGNVCTAFVAFKPENMLLLCIRPENENGNYFFVLPLVTRVDFRIIFSCTFIIFFFSMYLNNCKAACLPIS